MNFHNTSPSQKSTPSVDEVTSLLSEIDIGALRVEVEIEDILKGEIPSVVREVLTEILGQCHHWREEAWNRIQAVEQAEIKADMIGDGVDPDSPAAVDKWFDDEQKKRDQQIAKHQVSKRTGPKVHETGVMEGQ